MLINDDDTNPDIVPLLQGSDQFGDSDCAFYNKGRSFKDTRARTKLLVACVICMTFMVAEIIGGIFSNSLAILADSAHLFSDLSSFVVGLVAMMLSGKPSSKNLTFGWHRAEVLGAFLSTLLIWVVTGILVYTAILRIISNNFTINSEVMLTMSVIAVLINITMACVLHPHSHSHEHSHKHTHAQSCAESVNKIERSLESFEPLLSPVSDSFNGDCVKQRGLRTKIQNINLRAAFIHVIGDIIQSVGVLAASIIIYFKPEWKIADPICTFVFSVLVVITTLSIFFDIICILLERKPRHLNYQVIHNSILTIPGVSNIHKLRLWSITLNITAATCHIQILDINKSKEVLDRAHQILTNDFNISEVAIQIEVLGERLAKNDL